MDDAVPMRPRPRPDAAARYSRRVLLFGAAVVLVAVPFATLLFQVVAEGPLTRVDGDVADALNDYVAERGALLAVLRAVTVLGSTAWLTLVTVAAAGGVLRRGRRRLCVFLVVTCAGGAVVNFLVKAAVSRPRPVVDHVVASAPGHSFPSGHAMASTVVYGAVLLALLPAVRRAGARRAVVLVVAVLVLAIGSSRLFLGVHFLSDVLGGFALGLAWLAASVAAFEVWRADEGRRPVDSWEEGVEPEAGPALRGDEPS